MHPEKVFSTKLEDVLPKAIAFGPKGMDRQRNVMVFSLQDVGVM
jgi:hypothetical protein